MSDFDTFVLEEVANIGMGQSPPSASCNDQGNGLPFLQGCAEFGDKHPNAIYSCETPSRIAPKGSVLISVRAPVGTLNFADREYCIGRGLGFVAGRSSPTQYLYFLLDFLRPSLARRGQGSTFEAINSADLKRLRIDLPGVPQQRKIARILTTVDNLIEKTEALIAKYQAIKQGMMHDLFTRGVDEHGHLRPPYEEAPELYKQSELGWIPKEWEVSQLRKFLSYISYGFTNPMPETEEGPWMVTAANIFGGSIQYETCRHTARYAFDNLLTRKSRPSVGDILLTKDGTLGRIAMVDREELCINQSVAVLRPNGIGNADFLTRLLESPTYQQKMLDDAGGSTIKHIYITVVDKMLIGVPQATAEQQRIVNIMLTLDRQLSDEMAQRDKLIETKTGLMQDLLTGKVRVKVDEAEEVAVSA